MSHLPGIQAIIGDWLMEYHHLLLIQISHHDLQLLLRRMTTTPGPWVHTEDMPAVTVHGTHGVGWKEWIKPKASGHHLTRTSSEDWPQPESLLPPVPGDHDHDDRKAKDTCEDWAACQAPGSSSWSIKSSGGNDGFKTVETQWVTVLPQSLGSWPPHWPAVAAWEDRLRQILSM